MKVNSEKDKVKQNTVKLKKEMKKEQDSKNEIKNEKKENVVEEESASNNKEKILDVKCEELPNDSENLVILEKVDQDIETTHGAKVQEKRTNRKLNEKDIEEILVNGIKDEDILTETVEAEQKNDSPKSKKNDSPKSKQQIMEKKTIIKSEGEKVVSPEKKIVNNKSSPKKKKVGHVDDKTFFYRDRDFPADWFIKVSIRSNGKHGKQADSYFFTPCRTILRSRHEIVRFLSKKIQSKPSNKEIPIKYLDMPYKDGLCEEDQKLTCAIDKSMFNKKKKKVIKKKPVNDPTTIEMESVTEKEGTTNEEILQIVKEDENEELEPKMTKDNCFKIPNEENLRMLRSRKSVTKKETSALPIVEDDNINLEDLKDDGNMKKSFPNKDMDSEDSEEVIKAKKTTMKKEPLISPVEKKDIIEKEGKDEVSKIKKSSSVKKDLLSPPIKKEAEIEIESKEDFAKTRKSSEKREHLSPPIRKEEKIDSEDKEEVVQTRKSSAKKEIISPTLCKEDKVGIEKKEEVTRKFSSKKDVSSPPKKEVKLDTENIDSEEGTKNSEISSKKDLSPSIKKEEKINKKVVEETEKLSPNKTKVGSEHVKKSKKSNKNKVVSTCKDNEEMDPKASENTKSSGVDVKAEKLNPESIEIVVADQENEEREPKKEIHQSDSTTLNSPIKKKLRSNDISTKKKLRNGKVTKSPKKKLISLKNKKNLKSVVSKLKFDDIKCSATTEQISKPDKKGLTNIDSNSIKEIKPNENEAQTTAKSNDITERKVAQTDVLHSKEFVIKKGNNEETEPPKGTITLSLEKTKHRGPASKRKHSLTSSDSEEEDPEPKLAKLEIKVEPSTDDIHSEPSSNNKRKMTVVTSCSARLINLFQRGIREATCGHCLEVGCYSPENLEIDFANKFISMECSTCNWTTVRSIAVANKNI